MLQNLTMFFMWHAGAWEWSEITIGRHKSSREQRRKYGQVLGSSTHKAWTQPVLRAAPSPSHMDTVKKASWNSLRFYAKDHLTKYWAVIPLPTGQTSAGSPCSKTSSCSRLLRKLWFVRSKCIYFVLERHCIENNKTINYNSLVESEAKVT